MDLISLVDLSEAWSCVCGTPGVFAPGYAKLGSLIWNRSGLSVFHSLPGTTSGWAWACPFDEERRRREQRANWTGSSLKFRISWKHGLSGGCALCLVVGSSAPRHPCPSPQPPAPRRQLSVHTGTLQNCFNGTKDFFNGLLILFSLEGIYPT